MQIENKKKIDLKIPALITSLFFNLNPAIEANASDVISSSQSLTFSAIQKSIVIPFFKNITFAFDKSCESKSNQEYGCGEIPFGTKQFRTNDKFIADIVPEIINSDGAKGIFPYNMTKVIMSRAQHSGVALPQKLIWNPTEPILSSSYFGKDFYYKLFPAKDRLYAIACMYMPGVKVTIPAMTGFVDKSVSCWFDDANYHAEIATNKGELSFDSVKSCIALEIETSTAQIARNMNYKVKLLAIEKPEFINLKKASVTTTVNVRSDGGFCSFFTDLFGADGKLKKVVQNKFSAQINKQVSQLQDDYTDTTKLSNAIVNKMNNKVFTDIFGAMGKIKVVDNIGAEVKNYLESIVAPLEPITVSSYIEPVYKNCAKYADQISVLNSAPGAQLHEYCESLLQTRFSPYQADPQSKENGCYLNWTRLTEIDPNLKNTLQALKDCQVKHRLSVSVKPIFKALTQCYLNGWTAGRPDNCSPELKEVVEKLQATYN